MKIQNPNNLSQNYVPDVKTYTFAISDYFTRDMHEKNAAAIAMAMSQLDQNDIWAFVQRILMELPKYPDVAEDLKHLHYLYYGNGKIPSLDLDHIPLFYLKADAITDLGNVRIRGIKNNGEVIEVLPWATWQQLKKESQTVILDHISKIIVKIDEINNFNQDLKDIIYSKRMLKDEVHQLFNYEVSDILDISYYDPDTARFFDADKRDVFTFKRDSPDPDNRKFKIFSTDYSYNLQILVSQVFNSNDFKESMYHLCRVLTYLENAVETKAPRGNIFRLSLKRPLSKKFIDLVYAHMLFSDIMVSNSNMTTDERLAVATLYHEIRAILQFCQGKILSLVNYALTVIPRKTSNLFGRAEF